jgi:exodeoxyribonuclease V alpha subunit
MSAYTFQRDPSESAVEAWRPLDRALHRWVRAHGGSDLLARIAEWASFADGQGDTALELRDAVAREDAQREPDAQIAALRGEPMVGNGRDGTLTPFVIDADERFYLRRNHRHEVAVAAAICQRRAHVGSIDASETDVDALFHGRRDAAIEPQRDAVRHVGGRRLFVLTGGPGTGKTTTVLRMLAMLQRQRMHDGGAPLAMQLAAPTGKAAQRLMQAIQRGKQDLLSATDPRCHAQAPLAAEWKDALAAIHDAEALTVHRLLGFDPRRHVFRRNARHPIAADVVVVDEASMIDLAMLRSLLDALSPEALLVLVGDADQLTSIGAGSVLMDLAATMEAQGGQDIVRLRHSFRTEVALAAINESVRIGDAATFATAIADAGTDVALHPVATLRELGMHLRRWSESIAAADALRPTLRNMHADAATVAAVKAALRVLSSQQLLCALREGAFGAQACNAFIERQLKRAWRVPETAHWYPGRAVIVTGNDYGARLFNGDIGLCVADRSGELRVWFDGVGADGQASVRGIPPAMMPAHDSAFAITIHKSQGSEYDRVAVLLPPDAARRRGRIRIPGSCGW